MLYHVRMAEQAKKTPLELVDDDDVLIDGRT